MRLGNQHLVRLSLSLSPARFLGASLVRQKIAYLQATNASRPHSTVLH